MNLNLTYSILLMLVYLAFTPNSYSQNNSQNDLEEDYIEYYNHINNLRVDSIVYTSNGIPVANWLKQLEFLDGYRVPDFSGLDIDGNLIEANYSDELTLLNFWFTNCPPCVEEIPYLNLLESKYRNKLKIISLCRDSEPVIQDFVKKYPINYVVIPDAQEIIDHTFQMKWGYPKSILIGLDGRVIAMTRGFLGIEDKNYQKIDKRIKENIDPTKE